VTLERVKVRRGSRVRECRSVTIREGGLGKR